MQGKPVRYEIGIGTSRFLVEAMRCWRHAKDYGLAAQPSLYAQLSCHGQEMLAPVIDSLMSLFEATLGRRVCLGGEGRRSRDEGLLLSLLCCSRNCDDCLCCSSDLMAIFDRALCSTRLMMGAAKNV